MSKRKYGLALSLVLAAGTLLGACGADKEKDKEESNATGKSENNFSIAMVTDVGGIDDKSFNQSAWEGIKAFGEENNLKENEGYTYLQSKSEQDYRGNLNRLTQRDFDVVYGVGAMMVNAIDQIAQQQPDSKFVIIDGVVNQPNVASIMFKEQEGAFLAGVAAAMMTETKKIGFVGGMELPVIERFHVGFVEGVKAVDPNIEVDAQYTGAFDKAELGKAEAGRMYNSGVDIIFHAAGGTGNGVFSEAKERKAADPDANIWVIGVDSDQYEEGKVDDKTNVTLTSMLKRVDLAVQEIAKLAKEDQFPGGKTMTYGLAEDGVFLADSRGAIPQDVLDKVEEYKEKIASGEIKVPESFEKE